MTSSTPDPELTALRKAAAEVLALHRRSSIPIWKGAHVGEHPCLACTTSVDDFTAYVPWPCATVKAFPAVHVYLTEAAR